VGLYWVELSVCIIPPIIYNLLPPWMYPVLENHVNLLVCVLFVFAFSQVCTTLINLVLVFIHFLNLCREMRHIKILKSVGASIKRIC
jgi:hypothetical protein